MLPQFIQPSATPEAFRYGVKKVVGASAVKAPAVRTVQSPRVRESYQQGLTVRLPGYKGDTHGNMGSGSVHLEKPVYCILSTKGGCLGKGAGG